MKIANDEELKKAADQTSRLLREIQIYCRETQRAIEFVPEAQVAFPRGFIHTADHHRESLRFLNNQDLKSNVAYQLMVSEAIQWLTIRTDITGTVEEMLYKLLLAQIGTVIESVTKNYLHGICGKGFNARLTHLVDHKVITNELKDELAWVWEMRNRTHLFLLKETEYENDYNADSYQRATNAFRALVNALNEGPPSRKLEETL